MHIQFSCVVELLAAMPSISCTTAVLLPVKSASPCWSSQLVTIREYFRYIEQSKSKSKSKSSGLIENSIIRDFSRIVIEFFVDFQYFRLIASNYWFYSQIIVVKNSGPCATVLLLAVMSAKLCATVLAAALKPAVLIL